MRIIIELDEQARDRPSGTIAWRDTERRPFDGWVQLLHLLEAAIHETAPPEADESRDSPGVRRAADP